MQRQTEEKKQEQETKPEQVEQSVHIVTENQLILWKLDRIIELLEPKK